MNLPPDDRDPSEPQARQEYEQWLDEREKEMVENIEENMDKMFEYFFIGGQHE